MSDSGLPPKLQEVVDLFRGTPKEERLQLLLEFSESLPDPPARFQENPDLFEQVPECQTPFFLATDVEDGRVLPHFLAPEQAPTVRGYAGILHEGLSGSTLDEVLGVPDMFYLDMGLSDLISPLRLRGMGAILARLKNHVQQAA